MRKRQLSSKRLDSRFYWKDEAWSVRSGSLTIKGRPPKVSRLFQTVAEKLPFECLSALSKFVEKENNGPIFGVYLAHDSMGLARYGGRGNIFDRLYQRKRKYTLELVYFSFYVIENMTHEKEIETVILRAAGP